MLSPLYILGLEKPDTLTTSLTSPGGTPTTHTTLDQNQAGSPRLHPCIHPETLGSTPAESLPRPQQTSHHDVIPYHCHRHSVQPPYSKSSTLTTTFTSVNQHFPPPRGLHTFLFPYPRKSTWLPCHHDKCHGAHPTLHHPFIA